MRRGEKDNATRRKTLIGKGTIKTLSSTVLISMLVSVLVSHDLLLSSTGVALVDCSFQCDWLLAWNKKSFSPCFPFSYR